MLSVCSLTADLVVYYRFKPYLDNIGKSLAIGGSDVEIIHRLRLKASNHEELSTLSINPNVATSTYRNVGENSARLKI